jgi:hypothetical protein
MADFVFKDNGVYMTNHSEFAEIKAPPESLSPLDISTILLNDTGSVLKSLSSSRSTPELPNGVMELFPPPDSIIACGSTYEGKVTAKTAGEPAVSGFSKEDLATKSKELRQGLKEILASPENSGIAVSEKLVGLLQKLFPGKDKIVVSTEVDSPEITINFSAREGKHNLFKSDISAGTTLLVTLPDGKLATMPLGDIIRALKVGVQKPSTSRGCGLEPII